ncbi:hypothetical protein PVAG01_10236 [Phlyctema vagabunda]|uniref:C2H2-type domain-containing protein n=1 Tax=Phlyctema vagabunda TaxID=108571 RepID=A0ABR4P5C6_9HELO
MEFRCGLPRCQINNHLCRVTPTLETPGSIADLEARVQHIEQLLASHQTHVNDGLDSTFARDLDRNGQQVNLYTNVAAIGLAGSQSQNAETSDGFPGSLNLDLDDATGLGMDIFDADFPALFSNTTVPSVDQDNIPSASRDAGDDFLNDLFDFGMAQDHPEGSTSEPATQPHQVAGPSERRFPCHVPGCNVNSFKRKADLARHRVTKHSQGEGQFPCLYPFCVYVGARAFPRKDKLKAHQKARHHKIQD